MPNYPKYCEHPECGLTCCHVRISAKLHTEIRNALTPIGALLDEDRDFSLTSDYEHYQIHISELRECREALAKVLELLGPAPGVKTLNPVEWTK